MRTLKFAFLLFATILIASCNKEQIDKMPDTNIELGIETRHNSIEGFNFMTPCEAKEITYYIQPHCDEYWNSIMQNAIDKYNSAPISLQFHEIDSEEHADVVFMCVQGFTCATGVASVLPSNSTSDGIIRIATEWQECPCYDDPEDCNYTEELTNCTLIRLVMHEIGHVLGLHHHGEDDYIEGTPDELYQEGSIMNTGPSTLENCDWCDAPCEFSEGDILALQTLYCGCEPAINGPTELCIGQTATYCMEENFEPMGWSLSSNLQEISAEGNCVTVKYLNNSMTGIVKTETVDDCGQQVSVLEVHGSPNPNFNILYDTPVCVGTVFHYEAVAIPEGSNFEIIGWSTDNFMDIVSSEGPGAQIIANKKGWRKVCITAVNSCGIETSICEAVRVYGPWACN